MNKIEVNRLKTENYRFNYLLHLTDFLFDMYRLEQLYQYNFRLSTSASCLPSEVFRRPTLRHAKVRTISTI